MYQQVRRRLTSRMSVSLSDDYCIRNDPLPFMIEDMVVTRVAYNSVLTGPKSRGTATVEIERLMQAQCLTKGTKLKYAHTLRLTGETSINRNQIKPSV